LTLSLEGEDKITHWRRHVHGIRRYLNHEQSKDIFAKVKMTLKEYNDRSTPDIKVAYAFTMVLPNDIPST